MFTSKFKKQSFTLFLFREYDFIAACNIALRPSTVPDSMRLRLKDIKERLMRKHELVKGYCKMCLSRH